MVTAGPISESMGNRLRGVGVVMGAIGLGLLQTGPLHQSQRADEAAERLAKLVAKGADLAILPKLFLSALQISPGGNYQNWLSQYPSIPHWKDAMDMITPVIRK